MDIKALAKRQAEKQKEKQESKAALYPEVDASIEIKDGKFLIEIDAFPEPVLTKKGKSEMLTAVDKLATCQGLRGRLQVRYFIPA